MSTTAEIIKKPTNRRAGAVANPGMAMKIGDKKIATRNNKPVTMEERPVLPPSATPAELSTKVVVVEVPSTAPALVAIASAKKSFFDAGQLAVLVKHVCLVCTTDQGSESIENIYKQERKNNSNEVKNLKSVEVSLKTLTKCGRNRT